VSCVPEGRSARAADGNGGRPRKVSSIYRGAEQARKKTGDGVVESPNQQRRVFTSERIFCNKAPIFAVYCKISAMPTSIITKTFG
jgi:outer membrane receptor for monomeric catechols